MGVDWDTATKTISANLYNAVVVKDCHCRSGPKTGGPTCASNSMLLCRHHHTRLHRKGWSAEVKPDGELVVHNPDGRVFTSHPPGSRPRPPPALFSAA